MADPQRSGARLLDWYDRHHRHLPWRVTPAEAKAGIRPDPYRVWLSEIMLQQTRVEAVRPYFDRFLARWPDLRALAAAPEEDILAAWAGLGYYSRARNLKRAAMAVVAEHGGRFPQGFAELRALPGIGDYTAAAIAAIAFGAPEVVIDGNIERVVCRLRAIGVPKPHLRAPVRAAVAAMLPPDRPGDFAQAMMDLGATVCTPRAPACLACPLRDGCAAQLAGDPEAYPVRPERRLKPERVGAAFVAFNPQGAILLRRRPGEGLLAGMTEVPTTGWHARADGATGAEAAPFAADWRPAGHVRHVFTHFALELAVYRASDVTAAPDDCWWAMPEQLGGEALPSLFRKVIRRAL